MKAARRQGNWISLGVAVLVALALQVPLLEFLRQQTDGGSLPAVAPRRGLQARVQPLRAKPPEPEKKAPDIDGQYVTIPEPEKPKVPEETKHLARYDSDVEEEQKSERHGPKTPARRQGKAPVRKPSPLQTPDSDDPRETKLPKQDESPRLPKATPEDVLREKGDRAAQRELARGEEPGLLVPTGDEAGTLANLQTLSSNFDTDDALLDVEKEGETTLLKARSFRYWDFFERVKERVQQHWSPAEVYAERDPTGRIYGVKDRVTMLVITLDREGRVVRLLTRKESGLDFLDEEARRAIQAAQPFPNPPVGLLDEHGQATFGFGFLFEIGSSRHRFFWKRM